ncbi:hypothetical protein ASF62_04085 [Leifsonia sp. Leaf325]|nr:hypothetical protein [Leifsonia sp. Leaf325]KQQ95684.1 hypothetical protein ASF62_04085 [Leifsonia sp. Leaf325]
MFKPAMGVALAAGAVLVVSGLSAGVVALQSAFQVGESPAHTIGVDAVSGAEPVAESTPTPTADAVQDDSPAVVPVVADPVPVDEVAPVDDGVILPGGNGDVVAPTGGSPPDASPDTSAPVRDPPAAPAPPKPVAAVPPSGEDSPPDRTTDRSPAPVPDPTADRESSGVDRHRDGDRLERGDRDRDRDRDRDGDRDGADRTDRGSDRGARDDRGGRDGGHHRGDDRGQTGRDGSGD